MSTTRVRWPGVDWNASIFHCAWACVTVPRERGELSPVKEFAQLENPCEVPTSNSATVV